MPILPENKHRYHKNWKEIRLKILERAKHKCEFCGIPNYTMKPDERMIEAEKPRMVRVVLTIAHLDHTPENNLPSNLKALCQKCHNRHDIKHRVETRRNRKHKHQTSFL